MENFKPMLAGSFKTPALVLYPVIMSPKLDGIRIVIHPTLGPVTRSLKPIANLHIRALLNKPEFHYFDGEIIVGSEVAGDAFNQTQSAVMRSTGTPEFTLVVFDSFEHPTAPYTERFKDVQRRINELASPLLKVIDSLVAENYEDLQSYELASLEQGYEGIMFRAPAGPYKYGRSTERSNILVKVKQFSDSEARVVGIEYLNHNNNEATKNVFGRTERSSHKANKVSDLDQMGALVVEGIGEFEGVKFKIGTGYSAAVRQEIALMGDDLPGKIVTYRYQAEGAKDAPRFPVFHGFRAADDLS